MFQKSFFTPRRAIALNFMATIPGIGAKTAEKLLQHFGSLARLREAEPAEVEKVVGKVAAGKVAAYFAKAGDQEESLMED